MRSYKVEISETQKYVIDVLANNEDEAKEKATPLWNEMCDSGTCHFYEHGDAETDFSNIYDVTGTEDALKCEAEDCENEAEQIYMDPDTGAQEKYCDGHYTQIYATLP